MILGAPIFLWMAGLALPVVVLYILKVRRRAVTVPYLELWETLVLETRARSLFKRLKRLLSLLLQLLILAAIVAALVRPNFAAWSEEREQVVLLIDASASMGALEEDGRTRFAHALERAETLIETRDRGDDWMVVGVSDSADVRSSLTRNTIQLRESLEGFEVSARVLDAERIADFVKDVAAAQAHPRVVFVSDGSGGALGNLLALGGSPSGEGPGSNGESGSPEDGITDGSVDPAIEGSSGDDEATQIPFRTELVGAATENVGIVRFSTRRNTSVGTDYVYCEVQNFGLETRRVHLDLALDGSTLKRIPLELGPGESAQRNFSEVFERGGNLELSLEHEEDPEGGTVDALAIDDRAFAVVPAHRLRRILVITPDEASAEPFRVAIQSMAEIIDERSLAVTAAEYVSLDPSLRSADVTLVLGELPPDLPEGGHLILIHSGLPEGVPATLLELDPAPVVWDWDREHLLNRYLNYRDLPIPPAYGIRLDEEQGRSEVLVRSLDGPLVVAFPGSRRRVIYVAFDLTAELFPFRLAFPMLLRNALAWFEHDEDVVFETDYRPGDVIRPLRALPGSSVDAVWFGSGPDGEEIEHQETLPLHDGRFLFDRADEPGTVLFLGAAGELSAPINLFSAGESSIAVEAPDPDEDEGGSGGGGFFGRDLWTYLALAGLSLWTLEWALYHRRLTE